MLPAFQAALASLDDHYRILSLAVGRDGADTVVRLAATLARPIVVGNAVIMPDPAGVAGATMAVGLVLQIPLVGLGLALAWPAAGWRERGLRLALALPLLGAAVMADTPFTLWAYLWDIHVSHFEPDRFSPLLVWQRFLLNGGRLALGIGLAAAAIALAGRRPPSRP